MGRINSIETISNNLMNSIQDLSLKAVQGEVESVVRFFVGTVVNLDELNGRAKVRYMNISAEGESGYTDIECAIKTDEIIEINDVVIAFYIRNLSNSFIFGKMTSTYYSNKVFSDAIKNEFVSLSKNETIRGIKTFDGATILNGEATFNSEKTNFNKIIDFANEANPYVLFKSKVDPTSASETAQSYYVQGYQNKVGIGPGWAKSTIWDDNGIANFRLTPNVRNKSVAVIEESAYASDDGVNFTHWIRFTNGIQILWGHFSISKYSTGERVVNFNKAFSDIPSVSFNPVSTRTGSSYNREIFPMEVTSSSVKIYWNTGISISGYDLIAFGHWSYTITKNITNGTAAGPVALTGEGITTITVIPASGYKLPDSITVVNSQYEYDSLTGEIKLFNATGNVEITVVCEGI